MSETFLWKPVSENNGRLVVLLPNSLNGQISHVEIVNANGQVMDRGTFTGNHQNGGRGHYRFSRPGGGYGNGIYVRAIKDDGSPVYWPIASGGRRNEGVRATSAPSGGFSNTQAPGSGLAGGLGNNVSPGSLPGSTISDGSSSVHLPEFVNFIPENYYLDLQQALSQAEATGTRNIERFVENFNLGDKLATETLNTEIAGLEKFLPRSSKLIRDADKQGNKDLLDFSNVFDARNLEAVQKATGENVAARRSIFDEQAPGVADAVNAQVGRAEGDQQRIRGRSLRRQQEIDAQPELLTPALEAVASRTARNATADRAAVGGFGTDSSRTRTLLDTVDFEKRLQLEQLNREDLRTRDQEVRLFDQDIRTGEDDVRRAAATSADLFQSIIAPGIVDFKPLQPEPRVTDIGGQIRPMPTRDAGSLRTGFASDLTDRSTISPTTAFEGDLRVQEHNRGIDLQALGFQQDVFNTVSAGVNNFFDKGEQAVRDETAADQFQEGLDAREQSELISGITSIATTALSAYNAYTATAGGGATAAEIAAGAEIVSSISGASAVGQTGAVIIPQGASIPTGYTAVGSAATASGEAGVMIAPTGGGFLQGFSTWLAGPGGAAAGVTAGAITGYLQFTGAKKLLEGKSSDLSVLEHAALFMVTGGLHTLAGPVSDALDSLGFGSGKNEEQQERDGYRDILEDIGLSYQVDGSHRIKLLDGTEFDIGKDGGATLPNKGKNIDGRDERFYYQVDFSNPISGQAVGYLNPASTILFNSPRGTQFLGHLYNAVTYANPDSLPDAKNNIRGIVTDAGITYADGVARLDAMKQELGASYDAYKNGWYQLFFG